MAYPPYGLNFGGHESDWEGVEVGVPQGSVLGPLLFLVYTNDIQNKTSLKVLNFAEDILLYKTFKKDSYKTGTTYVNLELDNISK